jgi:heparinase II/III-like protein
MTPDEIAWRLRSSLRDHVDRFLVCRRQRWRTPSVFLNGDGEEKMPGFRVCETAVGETLLPTANGDLVKQWYDSLLARAERIADHRLDYFDLKDKHLGDPILWNRDHKRNQDTPMVFCHSLDYRDLNDAGDCKYVWEPNRHHQLVVLGRAYRLSGDIRFANAVAEQLDSWLSQNPFGMGMNWRSGLELGIRLINWVWAIDLIKESGAISDELHYRFLDSAVRHIWEIDRKYSRGSSANNHLIGEAAGVFIAASYFGNLKHANRGQKKSWEILNHEIINQTYPDGGTKEQAFGYHLFVLQFFCVAGIIARKTGLDFPKSYWNRLEKMFDFLAVLNQGSEQNPAFGDGDDGYVLDLGQNPRSVPEWLSVGAVLFNRSDFKKASGRLAEPVGWMLGQAGCDRYKVIPDTDTQRCHSIAFPETGYYLLQHGERDSRDNISVIFDCGPLGMDPLAAHGHADALSFTLRAFGRDVLVDPGTYDYFSYPAWREYFRSTRAHNTVVIDGRDQSEMQGLFLWGQRAEARCLSWEPSEDVTRVVGEHNGYTHLQDPVMHRRTLELNGRKNQLLIRDDLIAKASHSVAIYFHFFEYCTLERKSDHEYLINVEGGSVSIELDAKLRCEIFKGSENPICGWISRGYHQKLPSPTLVGRCVCEGDTSLVCRIAISEPLKSA